jgi:hypothetical protein
VSGGAETEMKAFLLHVMNSSPKLKALQFCTRENISLNVAELKEFFQNISRLESLDVDCFRFDFENDSSLLELQLSSIRFTKLTKFRACIQEGNEKIYPEILNRCCFLQHLSLGPISVEIYMLRELFRNHVRTGFRTEARYDVSN